MTSTTIMESTQIGASLSLTLTANEGRGWAKQTIELVNLAPLLSLLFLLLLLKKDIKTFIHLVVEEGCRAIGAIISIAKTLFTIGQVVNKSVIWGVL